MSIKWRIIAGSTFFGLLFWVVDTVIDYLFFYDATFWGLLVYKIPPHELYTRLVVMGLFFVCALVISRVVVERRRAEKRILHLNAAMSAIRNVNQLITGEKDRNRVLQGVCDNLIETRGYQKAWVAILNKAGGLLTAAEAGLGEDFSPIIERLKSGPLTRCGRRALSQSGVVAIENPPSTCVDCPLSNTYGGRGVMVTRLEYDRKVYGLLSVFVPAYLVTDEEEQTLFEQVAEDIAFALHDMELEQQRKRAEEELRKKNEELESFNKIAVGRELKMIELKKEINELLKKLGKEPRYKIAE